MELPKAKELEQKVFAIHNEKEFSRIALGVYDFQFHNNPVYQNYCEVVNRTPGTVKEINEIPFLPISFFKTHEIRTGFFDPELVFRSSGTTGMSTSAHFVKSAGVYTESFETGFHHFYGEASEYCILGLLPSYLERGNSSLVFMVDKLIRDSGHPESGFYLNEFEKLHETLKRLESAGQKTILIGVSYALLDFAERFPQQLHHTIIMETGGMKGRGRELTKAELYQALKDGFGVSPVHSEYGMTELLSQAYAVDGKFKTPPWMKMILRDETDPFSFFPPEKPASGVINVIDLANIYSCSFIATDDIGKTNPDGSFEVLGRLDHSDIRGCSLLVL